MIIWVIIAIEIAIGLVWAATVVADAWRRSKR